MEWPRLKLGRLPSVGDGPRLGTSSSLFGSRMGGKGNDGPELAPLTAPRRIGTAELSGGNVISPILPMPPCQTFGDRRGETYGEEERDEAAMLTLSPSPILGKANVSRRSALPKSVNRLGNTEEEGKEDAPPSGARATLFTSVGAGLLVTLALALSGRCRKPR